MKNEYLEPLWEAFDTYADYPAIVDDAGKRATSYAELKEKVQARKSWVGARRPATPRRETRACCRRIS